MPTWWRCRLSIKTDKTLKELAMLIDIKHIVSMLYIPGVDYDY
jgi:hypothetical protein